MLWELSDVADVIVDCELIDSELLDVTVDSEFDDSLVYEEISLIEVAEVKLELSDWELTEDKDCEETLLIDNDDSELLEEDSARETEDCKESELFDDLLEEDSEVKDSEEDSVISVPVIVGS